MESMRIKGTFGNNQIDIEISTTVDAKEAAKFVVDFYEALVDETTETRVSRFMNKMKRINDMVQKLVSE